MKIRAYKTTLDKVVFDIFKENKSITTIESHESITALHKFFSGILELKDELFDFTLYLLDK